MSCPVPCHLNSARGYLVADGGRPATSDQGLHQRIQSERGQHRGEHLLAAGNSLEHFPHRGRAVAGTRMRELVTDYRYIIRYRVTREGTVGILRIRHTSCRPTTP